jgi:hypothetical protein
MSGDMLTDTPPMSNNERQRKFQLGHPGYDARRKARQRQSARRAAELYRAERLKEAEARRAAEAAVAATRDADGQLLLFPAMRPAA